jgi:hypothetical protein
MRDLCSTGHASEYKERNRQRYIMAVKSLAKEYGKGFVVEILL